MGEEEVNRIVDQCVEQLTNGLEPDLVALGQSLSEDERCELVTCVEAARKLEGAIVETSRQQFSRSRIVNLLTPDVDETVPFNTAPPDAELAAGQRLGDFEIVREIGRGGMGIVFEARQITLDRRVALKVLPPGIGWNKTVLERFQREARAAARVQHSHIIPVYQVAQEKGIHYFAMQLIDGFPLSRLARSPLAASTSGGLQPVDGAESWPSQVPVPTDPQYYRFVARIMLQTATAIDHAHRHGILHRDVKPSNLIVDHNGDVWITDFGLARLSTDASVTMSGQLIGTLNYMSPEQAAGGAAVGPASDIYSLGATLYELLTLRTPFLAKSTQELLFAIQDQDPPRPTRINPRVPADLEVVALKAMEKEPDRRFPSAGHVAADLQRWLDDKPILARRSGMWRRSYKWARRKRTIVAAALVVAAILVGATWTTRSAKQKTRAVVEQQRAEQQVTQGQSLFEQERFEDAQLQFTKAAEFFSELLTGTDRFADALAAPVELGKETLPYVYLGLIALRDQSAVAQAQAAQQFELALRAAPDNALLRGLKVVAETHDYDQVKSVIRQIESFPADVDWGPFAADAYLALARIVEFYDINAAIRLCTLAFETSQSRRPPDALAFRGWLNYQIGAYEEAIGDLDVAFALKRSAQCLIWRAKARAAEGQSGVARVDFDKAVELEPDSIEVRAERLIWMAGDWGLSPRKHRDPATSRESLPGPVAEELAALVALSPIQFQDHFFLARAYQALGLDQQAAQELELAGAGVPDDTVGYLAGAVHRELARAAEAAGSSESALAHYARAIDACPHREFFEGRGRLLARFERWEAALRDFQEALRRDGESVSLRMARAQAFVALEELDEAVQELLQVLNAKPGHRPALELMADIRLAQNNPSAAVELLSMLAGLYPGEPDILQRRASARVLQGNESGALRDLEQAVAGGLPFANAHSAIGAIYEKLRWDNQALAAYSAALNQAPDDETARLGRIRMLGNLNLTAEALSECEHLLAARPGTPEALALRAGLRARQRDEAGAISDWRAVLRTRPDDDSARWNLARLCLYSSDPTLRNPEAVAALAGFERPAGEPPSDTDHRIRAHLYFAKERYAQSAEELNHVGDRTLEDWLVVSRLRTFGYEIAGERQEPQVPMTVDVTLPPWLWQLPERLEALQGPTKGEQADTTRSETEQ